MLQGGQEHICPLECQEPEQDGESHLCYHFLNPLPAARASLALGKFGSGFEPCLLFGSAQGISLCSSFNFLVLFFWMLLSEHRFQLLMSGEFKAELLIYLLPLNVAVVLGNRSDFSVKAISSWKSLFLFL